MTDQQPPAASEPAPDGEPAGPMAEEPTADAAASTRAREWLSQLETMIQNVAREAAPVARDVGAKAAELAAVAAVKAGPAAQKAAAVTAEYGQRFAEKAQSVAADWRHENEAARAAGDGEAGPDGSEPAADQEPAAPPESTPEG